MDRLQCYVINLKRRPDRKQSVQRLLAQLDVKPIWVSAVDGNELKSAGGRVYHKGGGKVVITFDRDGQRETYRGQWGHNYLRGLVKPWPYVGACLSHKLALEKALRSNAEMAMICEDDLHIDDISMFWTTVQRIVRAKPNLECVQFGSQTAGVSPTKRKQVAVLPLRRQLRIAHRNYQAHCYLVSRGGMTALLRRLEEGKTPDGAIVAEQNHMNGRYFYVHPALVVQKGDSETSSQGSWEKALRGKKHVPMRKVRQSGAGTVVKKRILKRSVSMLRAKAGEVGGKSQSGSGSTRKDIEKKMKAMTRYLDKHGSFPTKVLSASLWKVSTKLWARVRKETVRV